MIRPRLFAVLLGALLLVWLLGPALVGQTSFAFRDAAHYYHPLFEYLRQEWGAGRVPLWNPYENCGVPLVAENSSSVFYPGKLLFALPLDYTWLYNWYIGGHLVLAGLTSYALARRWQASHLAAGCAALAYAASGNVLFQYCNVVFLVGAAWLPAALLLGDRMLCGRQYRAALGLGLVLALMVLGGDPQMAYNAVLLIAFEGLLLWRRDRQAGSTAERSAWIRSRWVLLGIAGLSAAGLAAVQVLPTLEGAPYSRRSRFDSPRNVYELGGALADGRWGDDRLSWHAGLLGNAPRGHQRQIYQFSVAPWRAAELVWPNVTGRVSPTDRRWLGVLGAEYSVWTPSLYLGLLPLVLALATFSLRKAAEVRVQLASWLVLLGALGSLGHYGLAWLLGLGVGPDLVGMGGEVGGLYWLLCVLLPKYVAFRYPAKLFVVATLGLALLAATGWDRLPQAEFRRRVGWILGGLIVASFVAFGSLWYYWPELVALARKRPAEPLLGPFDSAGAWSDAQQGIGQTLVLAVLLILVLWRLPRSRRLANALPAALLLLVGLDLAVAQRALLVMAPRELWQETPKVLARLPSDWNDFRLYRQIGPLPPRWSDESSGDRYSEVLAWDRETLWPKFPLPLRIPLVEASQTMASDEYQALLDAGRRRMAQYNHSGLVDPYLLDLFAARFSIIDRNEDKRHHPPALIAEGMKLKRMQQLILRASIVHRVETIPSFRAQGNSALDHFTREFLYPAGNERKWREVAVVESDQPVVLPAAPNPRPFSESCTIVKDEPSTVEIEATLTAPGLVVLSDLYYPGWELTVETAGKVTHPEILRANRVFRGVALPAGSHRLVYRYRPWSVYWGGAISAASLMLLLLALLTRRVYTRAVKPAVGGDRILKPQTP